MTPTPPPPEHDHFRLMDSEDVERHHHHRLLNGKADTHQRWITTLVSAGIIGLLVFFASENYRMVNARIDDQKSALHGIVTELQAHQSAIVEMQTNQRTMMDTQKRIESKVDLLLAKVR